MNKTTLSVELPEPLRGYVKERVKGGVYADEGEYVRNLILRDREAQASKRLSELVQEGLDSGAARPMTEFDWADLRARALQSPRNEASAAAARC